MSLDLHMTSYSLLYPLCRIVGRVAGESYLDRRAAELGERVSFTLEIPRRCGVSEVQLRIFNETRGESLFLPFVWRRRIGASDRYEISFDTARLGVGLCFLTVICETPIGKVYSDRQSGDCFRLTECDGGRAFQMLVSRFLYPAPERYYGGIVYQIFVDRFARGEDRTPPSGMELVSDWNELRLEYPPYPGAPMKNNIVYGGNLDGIRRKLDYLAELGVSLLYLTPIFSSPSNHKYDTADYETIDPLFGDEESLRRLIDEAEQKGIGIILDGVFNHTGSDSVYFNQKGRFPSVGAAESPESPYYSWYRFYDYPSSYECWWNIDILPRIRLDEPSCAEYFVGDGGIIERLASFGIAGMRLDVADELPDEFIERIKRRLNEKNPESLLYGEVWEDASNKIAYDTRKRYYLGSELDGVMNYPLRRAVLGFLRDGDVSLMRYFVDEVMPNTPKRILHAQMNLIGTHDTPRAMTALAGDSPDGHTNAELFSMKLSSEQYALGIKRMKQAMAIISFMPGLPMIYYGDEVGMQGYSDPFNRLPFPWGKEDLELLSFYQRIGKWRRRRAVLRRGEFSLHRLDPECMICERFDRNERAFLIVNRSETTFEQSFYGEIRNLIEGRKVGDKILVEPNGFALFTLHSPRKPRR